MAVPTAAGLLHCQIGTSRGGSHLYHDKVSRLCVSGVTSFPKLSVHVEASRIRLERGTKLECALRSTSLNELASLNTVSGHQLRQKSDRRKRRSHTVCEAVASVDTRPEIEASVNVNIPATEAPVDNSQDNGGRQYFPLASVVGQVR